MEINIDVLTKKMTIAVCHFRYSLISYASFRGCVITVIDCKKSLKAT